MKNNAKEAAQTKFYFSKTLKIEEYEGIHLLQDHIGTNYSAAWNDYDFITTFNIYRVHQKKKEHLGPAKVLANGFKDTSEYFEKIGVRTTNDKIREITNELSSNVVVSLAKNIDYYQKLRRLLTQDQVSAYLGKLGDASYYYDNLKQYRAWPGFSESLLRNGYSSEAILKKGHQVAAGRYVPEDQFTITVDFPDERVEPIDFEFSNKGELGRSNINLIIGKNGAGKTFILRHLIELITSHHADSKGWPYFHKVIVAAYSPFENFHTKNSLLEAAEKEHSSRSTKSKERRLLHVNEYGYIGFKNESGDFSLTWPKEHSAKSLVKILQYDNSNSWWNETSRLDILFDTLRLCIDFDSIALKTNDGELLTITNPPQITGKALKDLHKTIIADEGVSFIKNGRTLPLSSGQIIYSYLLPCLVAEIEDESLVIVDEPELYLHPALEVGLIDMMKNILRETNSYAIVATHSAVMAREVEKSGITILKSTSNGKTESHKPTFETFGESLELIIGEAFDDYTTKKPYQNALDDAISKYSDLDEAIKSIGPKVGDEALAYLASKLDEDTCIDLKDD